MPFNKKNFTLLMSLFNCKLQNQNQNTNMHTILSKDSQGNHIRCNVMYVIDKRNIKYLIKTQKIVSTYFQNNTRPLYV